MARLLLLDPCLLSLARRRRATAESEHLPRIAHACVPIARVAGENFIAKMKRESGARFSVGRASARLFTPPGVLLSTRFCSCRFRSGRLSEMSLPQQQQIPS